MVSHTFWHAYLRGPSQGSLCGPWLWGGGAPGALPETGELGGGGWGGRDRPTPCAFCEGPPGRWLL